MYPITPMHVELWMKERQDEADRQRFAAAVSALRVHRPGLVTRIRELLRPAAPATCTTCAQ